MRERPVAFAWTSLTRCACTAQGASASIYALLACNAVVDPYRRFVWLFGLQLNSLGCVPAGSQQKASLEMQTEYTLVAS